MSAQFSPNACVVAFDTSNYTTSAAVCTMDGKIIANLKIPLPVAEGERGLRQSDALFAHTRNLPALTDRLAKAIEGLDPVAVGVSSSPRAVEGSYMPCFLCGVAASHSFAAARSLPVYTTAHQNGHVMAALYSCKEADKLLKDRFIAFHVSGGTTEALLVTPSKDVRGDFDIELVGETRDINAGQAIDRVGVMMGLSFPCGRELESLAASYNGTLPKRRVSVSECSCDLSGVENIARNIYLADSDRAKTAAFVFDFIGRTLKEMTLQVLEKYGSMPVLYAGGVMSNKLMRETLSGAADAYFCEPEFSSDNAAGVALIARAKILSEYSKEKK